MEEYQEPVAEEAPKDKYEDLDLDELDELEEVRSYCSYTAKEIIL